jgi:hypothetical protein
MYEPSWPVMPVTNAFFGILWVRVSRKPRQWQAECGAICDLRFTIYARAKAPSLLRPAGAFQNRMVVMFRHRTPNMQAKGGVNLSLSAATSGAHPAPKLNHAALVVECRVVFP